MQKPSRRLIPDARVSAKYGVSASTLYNWDHNPKMKFPKPIYINGRKFRDEIELAEFDEARAAERETEPTQ